MDIAKEKSASDLTDRCRGAIWGQFIGDAACAEASVIGQHSQGEPDKEKQPGELTHYGEAALLLLQSIAELGYFSAPDFGPRLVAHFSAEEYQGELDASTKGTIEKHRAFTQKRPGASYHYQGGADSDEPATATRLAPVVVNRLRQESLLKVVENATRVSQDNQRAIVYTKCHALITSELLSGNDLRQAIKSASKAVLGEGEYGKEIANAAESVFGMLDKDVREVAKQFGNGTSLKNCLPLAMHCALKNEKDLKLAIQETLNAGGDCAARAAIIGTWLGAGNGMSAIPAEWKEQLKAKDEINRCVEKIVAKIGK